jgi:hypothetical protein
MAFQLANRVRETSTTTGTGNFTLTGPVTGYRSFYASITSGNTLYYTIAVQGGSDWEVGIGTFTATATLARTQVVSNSAGTTTQISFGAGTKDVFNDLPSEYAVTQADVATLPNQVPLTQYLGNMAYQDNAGVNITGGFVSTKLAPTQPAPTALTGSVTLTTAQIQTQIIQVTSASAVNLTMPTGAVIDAAIVPVIPIDSAIDFSIINTGSSSGAVTVVVATGVTNIGALTLAINLSAQFRLRRTAINTYILYRLA